MRNSAVTLSSRQARCLERLKGAYDLWLQLIDGTGPETLTQAQVLGDWTIKDLCGHVVSWNREFRAEIEAILSDRHPGFERIISGEADFDKWNQHQAALKRDWPWERIRADLDLDFEEAVELICRLTPQDFRRRGVTCWKRAARERPAALKTTDTDSVETLVSYHWRHMNQHARGLEEWLKRR